MSKRFLIVGSMPLVIDGKQYEPGEEFTADLPADLESYLIAGEHVQMKGDETSASETAPATTSTPVTPPPPESK